MNKLFALLLTAVVFCGVYAQDDGCKIRPTDSYTTQAHATQQKPKTVAPEVQQAFERATLTVIKNNLIEVYDAKKNLLGYALYSKPYSDGINGFGGETPIFITFNTKKQITSVLLLPCQESPHYVKTVDDSGLFKAWNGLTPKEAKKKRVDAVSGATYTSTAVIESMKAAMGGVSK